MDAKTGIAQARCISKIQDGRHSSQLLNKKKQFCKTKYLKKIRFHVAGVRCHPEGGFKPLFFYIAGLLRGQNQPVDQVTAAALPKYGHKCTWPICDFGQILENRAYYTLLPTE